MLYTELFYAVVPTLFSYFLLFCYPYIFCYGFSLALGKAFLATSCFPLHYYCFFFRTQHKTDLAIALCHDSHSCSYIGIHAMQSCDTCELLPGGSIEPPAWLYVGLQRGRFLKSYSLATFWRLLESKNIYILYTYGKYLLYLENLSIWVLLKNTFDFNEEWRNLLPKRVDILAVFPVHWPWFSSYPFASLAYNSALHLAK